jgi:hypothetical protein
MLGGVAVVECELPEVEDLAVRGEELGLEFHGPAAQPLARDERVDEICSVWVEGYHSFEA